MMTFFIFLSLFNAGFVLIFLYFKNKKFNETALETTGKIVKLEAKTETDSEGDKKEVLYATVTFNGLYSNEIVEKSITKDTYNVGDIIPVFYSPNNPKQAQLVSKNSLKPMLIISVILFVIAICLAIYNRNEWVEESKQMSEIFYIGIALFGFGIISTWVMIVKKLNIKKV